MTDGVTRMSAGAVLGANIRALRAQQGLSLSELARRSAIAKGTLSQLENGQGNPTIETVFSLSNALNVPVSSLLAETPEPEVMVVRSAGLDCSRFGPVPSAKTLTPSRAGRSPCAIISWLTST